MEEYKNIIVENVESKINSINARIISGDTNILDSTKEMGALSRDSISQAIADVATELHLDINNLPFAVFFFGSPSRNLMLPNSDLDIGLVFDEDCSDEIKLSLRKKIIQLPFDKVDIASWSSIQEMEKENCPDMIEYSKATDAKFIAGSTNLSKKYIELIRDKDTKEDKINRFITEFGLLHKHDYLNKRTDHGQNLKYDFGASRDVIFLDWYYIMNNKEETREGSTPFFIKSLDILCGNKSITTQEYDKLKSSIDLILLVKFTLLNKYRKTDNAALLHLSNLSLHKCFFEAKYAFQNMGINSAEELNSSYYNAKLTLHNLVEKLYNEISISNPRLPGIWELAKSKMALDSEVLQILGTSKSWHEIVPFAVCSKSPEILNFIVNKYSDSLGYEYILRIISNNKSITEDIKRNLLRSRLPDKFKNKLII